MAISTSELFNFIQGSNITGESSYDIWKNLNPNGTEEEFLSSLRGQSAYEIWISKEENAGKTEEDFINIFNDIEDHINNKNNPHGTKLSDFGVTATATELNYIDGVTSSVQTQLNKKLEKTTYEYNSELAIGSSGKVCIGKFPMYDSNVSVEIKSTTNKTFNGTLIIATQNINTTGGGVYTATVYGDANNALTESIKIHYGSGSNVFSVYIDLPSWSKNLLHIQ